MRILYLSLSYVPSRRASSVQVMRMCEAFAGCGHEVTLVAKRHDEPAAAGLDIHDFYGVAKTFEVDTVPRPRRRGGGVLYGLGVAQRVLVGYRDVDLVYCRDLVGAGVATSLGMPVVFEAHGVFDRRWQRAIWRRMVNARSFRGLVVISSAMERELDLAELLPSTHPIVVAHSPANAVANSEPRPTAAMPPRIGYVGSLYPGRGVELVIKLAARMPGCVFELVGGTDEDLASWRASSPPPNVVFQGFVPPANLHARYREFDVLLMPYPRDGIQGASKRLDTAKYCSPMKMFEYMASGVPMVASDLPVLQEVLVHERNALIAPSGDEAAWQAAIERLISERDLRLSIAGQALADLEAFTPQARTERIFGGLGLG